MMAASVLTAFLVCILAKDAISSGVLAIWRPQGCQHRCWAKDIAQIRARTGAWREPGTRIVISLVCGAGRGSKLVASQSPPRCLPAPNLASGGEWRCSHGQIGADFAACV